MTDTNRSPKTPAILLLRHEAASAQSAAKLEHAGYQSVQMPISKMEFINTPFPQKSFDALILTSPAALSALKAHQNWEQIKPQIAGLKLFCVGEKTASLAKNSGFTNVQSFASHAAELNSKLVAKNEIERILYPSAKNRSFNFKAELENAGKQCEEWEIYANKLLDPGEEIIADNLGKIAVILFYSARTARHFFKLIERYGLNSLFDPLKFVAISAKVEAQIPRNWRTNTYIADRRDENSMFAVLETICRQNT